MFYNNKIGFYDLKKILLYCRISSTTLVSNDLTGRGWAARAVVQDFLTFDIYSHSNSNTWELSMMIEFFSYGELDSKWKGYWIILLCVERKRRMTRVKSQWRSLLITIEARSSRCFCPDRKKCNCVIEKKYIFQDQNWWMIWQKVWTFLLSQWIELIHDYMKSTYHDVSQEKKNEYNI